MPTKTYELELFSCRLTIFSNIFENFLFDDQCFISVLVDASITVRIAQMNKLQPSWRKLLPPVTNTLNVRFVGFSLKNKSLDPLVYYRIVISMFKRASHPTFFQIWRPVGGIRSHFLIFRKFYVGSESALTFLNFEETGILICWFHLNDNKWGPSDSFSSFKY